MEGEAFPMPQETANDAITAAIADAYAQEPSPEQLAEQLRAVAAAHGLAEHHIMLWIHDRPRHEMSTAAFVRWCQRYGFLEP